MASFAGSSDYTSATASTSFAISGVVKTVPTVTVTDNGAFYNGAAFTATDSVNGGPSLEGVTLSLTYRAGSAFTGTALSGAPSAAGVYTVVASFAGSTDFTSAATGTTFDINRATPSINVIDASGTANGAAFIASDSVAGVGSQSTPGPSLEGAALSLTYYAGSSASGTALSGAPKTPGTYTALASFGGTLDYTSGAASTSFVIGTVTQSPSIVTVTDNSGIYNSAVFTATDTVNGGTSLESVTPSLSYYSGTSVSGTALSGAPSNAGTYTVLASFAGSLNYTSSAASTSFTINKATPSVNVIDASGTANGSGFRAIDSVAGVGSHSIATASLEGVTPSLTYFAGTSGTALGSAPSTAGTYTVLASFAGSTDYTSATATTTVTISPSQPATNITVTASTTTRTYGQIVDFTATVTSAQTPNEEQSLS